MRFPDFLCIGVQKAATTWLYKMLCQHNGIWLPPIKEIHYFNELYLTHQRRWTTRARKENCEKLIRSYLDNNEEINFDYLRLLAHIGSSEQSDQWYGKIFDSALPNQKCGEITPEYSQLENDGIEHILKLNAGVKIILILRDPIHRAWSHMRKLKMDIGTDYNESIKFADLIARGGYRSIVERWKSSANENSLLITFTDNIFNEPEDALVKVCSFIGVSEDVTGISGLNRKVYQGPKEEMPDTIYDQLRETYEDTIFWMKQTFPMPCEQWYVRHYSA